jgi:transcriptional regulator
MPRKAGLAGGALAWPAGRRAGPGRRAGGRLRTLKYVYLPPHFAAPDTAAVARFVDQAAAADLVTFDGTKPVASLIPVIWDRDGTAAPPAGHGRLLGHLAVANPQWRSAAPGAAALAIVHGSQAYVSPAWYPSKERHGRVVPTWNYVTVHFTGTLTMHRDPGWLREVVTRLTERHEAGRPHPWSVDDAPPDYLAGQLRGIVGVELIIDTVEAKHKLSQNRGEDDRAAVIAALRGEPGEQAAGIAALMAAGG